jgi:hypothetical protein
MGTRPLGAYHAARYSNVPSCLKGLTDKEDMPIARVKSYLQVRWTKGRQLCYQDHGVKFRQGLTKIATRLPRLPVRTDIVVIRKEDVDLNRNINFMVRREKVKVKAACNIRLHTT